MIGHTIKEWEDAISERPDIEYETIFLKDGFVKTVIGIITLTKYSAKTGKSITQKRKARWNQEGACTSVNMQEHPILQLFNINFDD